MRPVLCLVALCLWASAALAEGRFALVIGNTAYDQAGPLPNAVNDATDIATAFEDIGYTVSLHLDADYLAMSQALRSFRRDSRDADHAVIFFAGHGLAPKGTSYVLPTDAYVETADDLEVEAIAVDELSAYVSHASELGLIILDACRDTALMSQLASANGDRSLSRGLARASPRGGTLIAYATEAGAVAKDGDGRNSPYTAALIETLREPGLEVGFLFRSVRDRVLAATGGSQRPDHFSALPAVQIYLNPPQHANTVGEPPQDPTNAQAPTGATVTVSPSALDLTFWQGAMAGGTAEDFQDYLTRFPNGQFSSLAKRRLRDLRNLPQQTTPANPGPSTSTLQTPTTPQLAPGNWFVVLGSYPKNDYTKAQQRLTRLQQRGVPAAIIDSNLYSNLSNGLFVVVLGPTSRSAALHEQSKLRTLVPDAYIKKGS